MKQGRKWFRTKWSYLEDASDYSQCYAVQFYLTVLCTCCCLLAQFMFKSLWPRGLQHAKLPCPSPSPRACSNSCPSSQWCHPTMSSSVVPFSPCLQSFPASGSFLMSQLFASGSQSIGVSASASVLPKHIQDWFPLELIDLISLQSKGLSRVFSTPEFKSINSLVLSFLYGPVLTSILTTQISHHFLGGSTGKESTHNAGDLGLIPGLRRCSREGTGYPLQYSGLKNSVDCIVHGVAKNWTHLSDFHFLTSIVTAEKAIPLTIWTFVGKVMSLIFNKLFRLVIAFLPRSKCLLISWLQSPSAVILEPPKIKSVIVSIVSHLFAMKRWDQIPWSLFFECWILSQLFTLLFQSRGSLVPMYIVDK